jgi:hypothetical protein
MDARGLITLHEMVTELQKVVIARGWNELSPQDLANASAAHDDEDFATSERLRRIATHDES